MQKFVLCRPQSGLNDMLNQIELCCRYGLAQRRIVIVDTAYRNTTHFKDSFSKYFISRQKFLLLENPLPDKVLDSLDVFPPFLKGRLSSYQAQIAAPWWKDKATDLPLTFDFDTSYPETVVVHHQGGGGLLSVNALQRLQLAPWLIAALEVRIAQMGQSYAGMHIRNTDMKTRYQPVIEKLRDRKIPLLFLATDDRRVLTDFRNGLPETRILSFSTLPDNGGRPLHIDMPNDEAAKRNADAILDLLTLSLSKPLMIAKAGTKANNGYSGFARLAAALHKHPFVLQNLLGTSVPLARFMADVFGTKLKPAEG